MRLPQISRKRTESSPCSTILIRPPLQIENKPVPNLQRLQRPMKSFRTKRNASNAICGKSMEVRRERGIQRVALTSNNPINLLVSHHEPQERDHNRTQRRLECHRVARRLRTAALFNSATTPTRLGRRILTKFSRRCSVPTFERRFQVRS
jgi:hypothetical protein